MDAAQFLARVVAPGNYIAVAYRHVSWDKLTHRFFPYDQLGQAANFLRWTSQRQMEAWYAVASYRFAQADAKHKGALIGQRTQANAQALKAFWIDIDVKRAGDKKQPDKVYTDVNAATVWLRDFLTNTKLPRPNLWVGSGYGLHVYWVLEDAMAPQDWQPYAEALKTALIANNAILDVGISADSARLLRPPETVNLKDTASPQKVEVWSQLSRGDYPNDLVLQALQPYVNAATVAKVANYSSGGNLAGSPPVVFTQRQTPTSTATAAAQQNIPGRRDYFLATIAERCLQAKTSLANNGLGDQYPLWYLGFISLAHFCKDGDVVAHDLSRGDPRYDPHKTDAALQQAAAEHQRKGTGAPTCAHFERSRPGICQSCPHFGKVNTPYTLGTADPDGDLPDGYKREGNHIVRMAKDEGTSLKPIEVVAGDAYMPVLDRIGNDRKLTFIYDRAGSKSVVAVMQSAVPVDTKEGMRFFGPQGVTLYDHNAKEFGRFIVAWIDKLRDMRAERAEPTPAFGWSVRSDNTYAGFAVGSMLYKSDGTVEPAPGGDENIIRMFQPRGSLDAWKQACNFVIGGRPDLQVLVAAAFAAPLIEFTGHSGFIMSAWSRDSAIGKSSALQIGTTVWADPGAMYHLKDTDNSILYRIGQTKVMPAYWDEVSLTDPDDEMKFVDLLFQLGQGKEKSRLNANSTLKTSGDWKTILCTTGNRPLMDYVIKRRGDTNAGAVRLFEFLIEHPQMAHRAEATQMIATAGKNCGNAGRVYAEWLAKNPDKARAYVLDVTKRLEGELQGQASERFFLAGMACLIVGAALATANGLAQFDIPAMTAFLKDSFEKLRVGRKRNLPIGAGVFDIERILASFVSDYAADRLVTNHFKRPGVDKTFKPAWTPRRLQGRLAVHIGLSDREMRIDREVFDDWAYRKGFSPSDLLHQLEIRWGAELKRGVLGNGTDFATGRVPFIALPLVAPELAPYNYSNDSRGAT